MGAIALVHALQPENDLGAAKARKVDSFRPVHAASVSRHVTRLEKERRRDALTEALKPRGSILDVAAAWNVSETQVRRVRDGRALLTDERIRTLPVGPRAVVLWLLASATCPPLSTCETTHAQSR